MSVSNKSLLVAVCAAFAVTFIGTFLAVSSFSSLLSSRQVPSTGYASSAQGNVTMHIAKALSITTVDSEVINFTGCAPGRVIYSNVTGGNDHSDCPSFLPASIVVRNDGGYEANITMNATDWGEAHGGLFLDSSTDDSWLAFSVKNDSSHAVYGGGCMDYFPGGWVNITNGSLMRVCDNLVGGETHNSLSFDVAIYVPNATGNGTSETLFTFWASQIW
ncbi:hypothetical protein JXA12_05710 [Candidatus Woesearchaeota archaeon]|nr:hypothetical protein [Candidatus Woesearchaeota archaeon]